MDFLEDSLTAAFEDRVLLVLEDIFILQLCT